MIESRELTRRYGSFTAVDAVSFRVEPGQVLGFLGPNGAGKSTTMKMLSGFLPPSSGQAFIAGHDVMAEPLAARRMLGYLPEGAPSYGEMTVRAFLGFVAGVRAANARQLDQAVGRLQLEGVLEQPVETLSKGFKRRVGLAAAIMHDPPVLILDEPTDGLDPNQKQEVRNLIRSMAADKAIILSTHLLEEVHAVCTRTIIIAGGQILADSTPAGLEARSRYHGAVSLAAADMVAAREALARVAEVASIELDHHGRRLTAFPKPGKDIFMPISGALRERGITVSELALEGGRLDEVFRTITLGVQGGEERP